VAELREKLRRKAARASDAEEVVSKLKAYGILDDQRYADALAAARLDSKSQGKLRVLRTLAQHRVPSSVARKAVDAVFANADEAELIEAFLRRKLRNINLPQYLSEPRNLASVYRKLRYAGFTSGSSIQVLRKYSDQAAGLDSLEDVGGES
jgi:regulatory protein